MHPKYLIRTLWIDDKPDQGFISLARKSGMDITVKTNVNDGLASLEDRGFSFDAVILDANCVTTGEFGEVPEVSALTYAIGEVNRRHIDIPWFVFSGEGFEGDNSLEYIVPKNRPWDDRAFYRKSDQADELLAAIKKAVGQYTRTRIKIKYADACNVYQEQDFIDLLAAFDGADDDFDHDTGIPNTIRGIMDWVCFNFFSEIFEGSNIGECSRIIGNGRLSHIIPVYVQRSFHLLSEYANAGSHRYEQYFGEKPFAYKRRINIAESLRSDISDGTAPYLNRLATLSLLTLLSWCYRLREDKTRLFEVQQAISSQKRQGNQ